MSGYVPSMVLLGGLYLEHRKEKLGKQFDTDEAWQEFMQFIKNKQAGAWDEGHKEGWGECWVEHTSYGTKPTLARNPYRDQEEV